MCLYVKNNLAITWSPDLDLLSVHLVGETP